MRNRCISNLSASFFTILVTLGCIATGSNAQVPTSDEMARVALAMGDNTRVLAVIGAMRNSLVATGSDISALNAYRAALAAERLSKANDAKQYFDYAAAVDPTLSFATSPERAKAMAARIGTAIPVFVQQAGSQVANDRAALATAPETIAEMRTTILTFDGKLRTMQKEVTTHKNNEAKLTEAVALRDQQLKEQSQKVTLLLILTALISTIAFFCFFTLFATLLYRRRRARLIQAALIPPEVQSFNHLMTNLLSSTNLALNLLKTTHEKSALFVALGILQTPLAIYVANSDGNKASFIVPPPESSDEALADIGIRSVVSSIIDSSKKIA